MEREREGLVERERDAQALGAWGESIPGTRAHTAFSAPKQTQRKSDDQSLLQKTKEENQMQSSPTIYTPLHEYMTMSTYFNTIK